MIAIMTILPRDAKTGAGGLADGIDRSLTVLSFQCNLGCPQRHAAMLKPLPNDTALHLLRESTKIKNHPSTNW
jgi:hypothetical protein